MPSLEPAPPRMSEDASAIHVTRICDLHIRGLRNLRAIDIENLPFFLIVNGPNGAGKTSLLEAVSLLTPTRGLRRCPLDQLLTRGGNDRWTIEASLDTIWGNLKLGCDFSPSEPGASDHRRTVHVDGSAVPLSRLSEWCSTVWLTPAMDGLFIGSPGERRRFLDRFVAALDPFHSTRINRFDHLLAKRNAGVRHRPRDHRWIRAIDQNLVPLAVSIAASRFIAVSALSQAALSRAKQDSDTAGFPTALPSLRGWLENHMEHMSASDVEIAYREHLDQTLQSDIDAGVTRTGPHRTDLLVTHGLSGMAAASCSTGEQKALLISLVLEQARTIRSSCGRAPLILLDDVTAHLDEYRRHSLIDKLQQLDCQVWLAGHDSQLPAQLKSQCGSIRMSNGQAHMLHVG